MNHLFSQPKRLAKYAVIVLLFYFFIGNIYDSYVTVGRASWYGKKFHGRKTANGEVYDKYALTAAHRRLPFGTKVKVTRLDNNREVIVRINDRGPYIPGRIIDLSKGAAKELGMLKKGLVKVKLKILGK